MFFMTNVEFIHAVADQARRKPVVLCVLLMLITLLLYGPVIHHEFLGVDDLQYVTQNRHVNTGLTLDNVKWAFAHFHEGNWHPLAWISHMADCQMFGLASGPPHMINLLIHGVNAILLFLLFQKFTGATWRSFLVAVLFVVHPLNVENVAWVAERKSLLCTMFSLLTIFAYGWYVRHPNLGRYLTVAVAFGVALMSKPMAVSLPFVLMLFDYWPLRRYDSVPFGRKSVQLAREKALLFLMSAVSAVVTIAAQRSGEALVDVAGLPVESRIENAIVSYASYIGRMIWPGRLSVLHPYSAHPLPGWEVAGSALVLLAITAGVVTFRRAEYLVFGWCCFIVTLIPVIGIVQVGGQAMADRYVYFPYIGLFVVIAWGLYEITCNAPGPTRFVPALVAIGLVVGLTVVSSWYLQFWQNGVKLFTRASVTAGSPNILIEIDLADALLNAGRVNEAYVHYQEACTLRPDFVFGHYKMAQILYTQGKFQASLREFETVARLTSRKDLALVCLIDSGQILMGLDDYEGAAVKLRAALQIDPGNSTALSLLRRASSQNSK